MSKFNSNDTRLLSEAYNIQILREQAPYMSLEQLKNRMVTMNESELEYITSVNHRILNEFFGGLKNIGSAIKGAGQAASNAVANKAAQTAQTAKQIGSGVASAGKQAAANIQDIYQTGNVDSQSKDAIKKAQTAMQQLIDLVTKAQQMKLIKSQGNVTDMTLANIIDELTTAQQSAGTFKTDALKKGIGGGVKQAFNKGRAI